MTVQLTWGIVSKVPRRGLRSLPENCSGSVGVLSVMRTSLRFGTSTNIFLLETGSERLF